MINTDPGTFLIENIQRRARQIADATTAELSGLSLIELDYQLEDVGTAIDRRRDEYDDEDTDETRP